MFTNDRFKRNHKINNRKKKYRYLLSAGLAVVLALSSCGPGYSGGDRKNRLKEETSAAENQEEYSRTDFVMDTVFQAKIYGKEDLTEDLLELLSRLEKKELSWRISDSEIARVNQDSQSGTATEISRDFARWTAASLDLAQKSEGAFDPTIGLLTNLWNIEGENPVVPAESEIRKVLDQCGWNKVHLDETALTISLDDGCTLDFGASGKGIGCDAAAAFLEGSRRVTGAVVSIGGSNLVYGSKPDGEAWKVAIQDPRGKTGELMGYISLEGTNYVSTSGDYEKYFEQDGKRYHHILDPHTGYPARSGLISVTVICGSGLLSDGLSTACFVLGKEKALALLESYGAEGILVDEHKNVVTTGGIRNRYTPISSDYKLTDDELTK